MRHRQSGFTLIEVLVAISLMSIALLGFASVGVNAIRDDSFSRKTNVALALAQAKLEQLRSLPYSNSQWTSGSHTESDLDEDGNADGEYTRSWVVTLDYNGHSGLRRVSVTVSWPGTGDSETLASLYW